MFGSRQRNFCTNHLVQASLTHDFRRNCLGSELLHKVKKTGRKVTAFLGEGIFTMGCSKNHIMYWGVFTLIIIAWSTDEVCIKFTIFTICFCAFLQQPSASFDKFPLQIAQHMPQIGTCVVIQPLSAYGWNSASNSSLVIFSFWISSSAQASSKIGRASCRERV